MVHMEKSHQHHHLGGSINGGTPSYHPNFRLGLSMKQTIQRFLRYCTHIYENLDIDQHRDLIHKYEWID